MISAISKVMPENPFKTGQDLDSGDTSIVLVDETDSSEIHGPERELYVGAGGAGARGEDSNLYRRLQEDFDAEGGVTTPTANIISTRHLLDGIQPPLRSKKSWNSLWLSRFKLTS